MVGLSARQAKQRDHAPLQNSQMQNQGTATAATTAEATVNLTCAGLRGITH